jgi:hypothetical protein
MNLTLEQNKIFLLPPGPHYVDRVIIGTGASLVVVGLDNDRSTVEQTTLTLANPGLMEGPFTFQETDSPYTALKALGGDIQLIGLTLTRSIFSKVVQPPLNLDPPVLSALGNTLTVTDGTWIDAMHYSYSWSDDNTILAGETNNTLSRSYPSDAGQYIFANVTAINHHGIVTVASNVLRFGSLEAGNALVLSSAEAGLTVTIDTEITWNYTPTTTTYQWYEIISGVATLISGATSNSYRTTSTHSIFLRETATNAAGSVSSDSATITVSPSTLVSGLNAHYCFDSNTNDSSGNGNDLFQESGASLYIAGKLNNCITGNANCSLRKHGVLADVNTFSMAFWIFSKASGGTNGASVVLSNTDYSQFITFSFSDTTNWYPKVADNNGHSIINSTKYTNQWIHVAIVSNNGAVDFYVNNLLIGSTAMTLTAMNELIVQVYSNFPIDELGVWNRVLTTTEINTLYNVFDPTA